MCDSDEVPFCGNFCESSEGEALEFSDFLDLSEDRFNDLLSLGVGASSFESQELAGHSVFLCCTLWYPAPGRLGLESECLCFLVAM